jgi:hypothetical protein
MNTSQGSVQAVKGRTGMLALLASCFLVIAALFGASNAKAATVGGPVAVDFNYVGINVDAGIGQLNEIVLRPETGLGALELRGTYTSADGAFTVPRVGGLTFPDLALDLGVELEAQIGLTEDATGTYNSTTGAMTFNPSISLTIGVSDLSLAPPPLNSFGSGPLRCQLAPLDVNLSTSGGWPAPGNTFDPGTFNNGAVAGAWTIKPDIVALAGAQATCDLIGGLLQPVGGLWLAQSATSVASLPTATAVKPEPAVCGDGFTGDPPNCVEIPRRPAKVAVSGKPKSVTIKRGRSGVVKVAVKNTGELAATSVKVCGTISARFAKAPKCVSLGTINAGSTKSASLKLTAGKRAKGKTSLRIKVTSAVGGSATSVAPITVK